MSESVPFTFEIGSAAVELVKLIANLCSRRKRLLFHSHIAEERLRAQLKDTLAWSSLTYFPGLPKGRDVESETISLEYFIGERKYRSSKDQSRHLSETEILSPESNVLILGAPGSGKSTTLKRFFKSAVRSKSIVNFVPVLIRIRDLPDNRGLFDYLFSLIAISAQTYQDKKEDDLAHEEALSALFELIDSRNIALFVDGLDECDSSRLSVIIGELIAICRRAPRCWMVATCRTGALPYTLENFTIYEIVPLTTRQITQIAKFYLGKETHVFKAELAQRNLSDLADRPLLVIQLVMLFQVNRTLPEQLAEVYHQIMQLLLRAWDESYRRVRRSKYAGFDPQKKMRFLQALAFELLFKRAQRVFSRHDLESAYQRIHRKFGLPKDDATDVALELQAHTGIIAESVAGRFEFFHLTMQEYLAAGYVIEIYRGAILGKFFRESPSTVAICVAVAHDSIEWLKGLVEIFDREGRPPVRSFETFILRLGIEHPRFSDDAEAAAALLALICSYNESDIDKIEQSLLSVFEQLSLLEPMRNALKGLQLNVSILRHVSNHGSLARLLLLLSDPRQIGQRTPSPKEA